MRLIYRRHCYFYRAPQNGEVKCALSRWVCLLCPYAIRKIQDLDTKDHLNVALIGIAARRGNFFSTCALFISLILLVLEVLNKYSTEVDNLLRRVFGL